MGAPVRRVSRPPLSRRPRRGARRARRRRRRQRGGPAPRVASGPVCRRRRALGARPLRRDTRRSRRPPRPVSRPPSLRRTGRRPDRNVADPRRGRRPTPSECSRGASRRTPRTARPWTAALTNASATGERVADTGVVPAGGATRSWLPLLAVADLDGHAARRVAHLRAGHLRPADGERLRSLYHDLVALADVLVRVGDSGRED